MSAQTSHGGRPTGVASKGTTQSAASTWSAQSHSNAPLTSVASNDPVPAVAILANALPGFRDLRAPALAGYLWLAFAWLVVDPDLSHKPRAGLGSAVFELGHRIGHFGVAAAASVAAYLIGSVSQSISRAIGAGWRAAVDLTSELLFPGVRPFPGSLTESTQRRIVDLYEQALQTLPRDEVERQARLASQEAQQELMLPATLLVGAQPELFAEVDRLRSEGELRLAVVPPLAALMIVAALGSSPAWLLAVPPIVAILNAGVHRDYESRHLIAQAIARGQIKSASLEDFRSWIIDKERELAKNPASTVA